MIYTFKRRKQLNAQYIAIHQPRDYTFHQFGGCERLQLVRPPLYATRLDGVKYAESLAAKYWLDYRLPMPILVRVITNARTGSEAYDVNYVNPNNHHDIELVERYIATTTVYAIDTIPT